MTESGKTQVAVIGGGPGGYAAAFRAADLGLDVTLIDLDPNPGGTCLYRGCIPSKALLHVARIIRESKEAEYFGVHFSEPSIDIDRVREATALLVRQGYVLAEDSDLVVVNCLRRYDAALEG